MVFVFLAFIIFFFIFQYLFLSKMTTVVNNILIGLTKILYKFKTIVSFLELNLMYPRIFTAFICTSQYFCKNLRLLDKHIRIFFLFLLTVKLENLKLGPRIFITTFTLVKVLWQTNELALMLFWKSKISWF